MSGDKTEQPDSSVFITVRYQKQTVFLQFTETNTIREVKEQISRLLGMTPEEQKIWSLNSNEEFEEQKILQKCGIKGDCAMAYKPFELYLTTESNGHEKQVVEYSAPPELPDVMKPATDVEK
jgi:hypothetical protein